MSGTSAFIVQPSPGLHVRAVHAGRLSRRTTATSFGQLPPTRRAKNTTRYVLSSCVRRGWSNGLEHTEQQPARSRTQHRQLRSLIKDTLISAVCGALSALEALCDNVLYKLTLTLLDMATARKTAQPERNRENSSVNVNHKV